ncbi:hypothetical protein GCM10011395_18640 [Sphingomonas psychrolutea]|uniref:GNAT family N-acetyltransferase n=2 Tax=Sphingomonas psychrolutea TaxID=1259676 RepID=A0ABQ1GRP2_9SPHN|nr:hypothetical protein GCM10011395_18640 [Sphingomonas psychrolutea]
MRGSASAEGVDPGLLRGWLAARSVARGLPAPMATHGGWRVDTRSDAEWCRYVFAAPDNRIADLAATIGRPDVLLKLCAADAVLAALLPAGWQLDPCSWFMTAPEISVRTALPTGYTATIQTTEGAHQIAITAPDGSLAASGYAAEINGVFCYDRIVTSADHRRRGLGTAVMALLGAQRALDTSRHALVATDQGRALYETLGWRMLAPYATAFLPAASCRPSDI